MINNSSLKITAEKDTDTIIRADTRKALVTIVSNFVKSFPKKGIALYLKANCGCERKYKTVKDIPKRSVKCKHGRYFIKYEPLLAK